MIGNDVTDAFHDSEVAVIAYAATNSIKFNNPEELGASGFAISSPFNTDKLAFQLLNSVYLRIRINSNAMWKISSSQNLKPISTMNYQTCSLVCSCRKCTNNVGIKITPFHTQVEQEGLSFMVAKSLTGAPEILPVLKKNQLYKDSQLQETLLL